MEDHWVYRAFDVAGTPIYVGYSGSGATRLRQHQRRSAWAHLVARFEIEHFDSANAALARERELIYQQNPAYNVRSVDRDSIPAPEGMWNVKQVAEWLQFSCQGVRGLARRGEIPSEKKGAMLFFWPGILDAWMKEHVHVP